MGKRKRRQNSEDNTLQNGNSQNTQKYLTKTNEQIQARALDNASDGKYVLQIIIGTYGRVLHGLLAIVGIDQSALDRSVVEFADTFLFNAHDSAIRCLALSPIKDNSDKVLLASGGTDQVVNLFSLDAKYVGSYTGGVSSSTPSLDRKVIENTKNRELGSLQHHEGGVNALYFPTKSKLLTAADDNTIAVARTKDWTVLSTIKAPSPKVAGHASGDAAPPGLTGVNDLAIHPSLKLMISVGKRERCMRLWNLMTGKKAAVLSFERSHLQSVGENKHSSGEGQKVRWNAPGEEFAIAFDRGCLVYGIDCKPRIGIYPVPRTKIHQLQYVTVPSDSDGAQEVLALSTDDGRVLFHSTRGTESASDSVASLEIRKPIAQLRPNKDGISGRIKDFRIRHISGTQTVSVTTVNSEGSLCLWVYAIDELAALVDSTSQQTSTSKGDDDKSELNTGPKLIGHYIGTCETGQRITCMEAFQMLK